MNLLLDTHAFIWYATNDAKLPSKAKSIILDGSNRCYVSICTLWEMTIKQSLNKLDFNTEVDELISLMEKDGLTLLYVLPEHLTTLKKLPHHHNDPFDRLLISQALCENFTIISGDKMFENYGVNLFWSKPS